MNEISVQVRYSSEVYYDWLACIFAVYGQNVLSGKPTKNYCVAGNFRSDNFDVEDASRTGRLFRKRVDEIIAKMNKTI